MMKHISLSIVLICLIFLSGCSTPIGVTTVSPRTSYMDNNANPLNAGVLSNQAKYVFNRYDLLKAFANDPESGRSTSSGILSIRATR